MTTWMRRLPLVGRRFREDIAPPGAWSGPADGRRVLIEEDDGELRRAMAEALRDAGFQTAECAGPGTHGERRCPLVEGHGCDAVDRADAVLQVFVPSDAAMREVREAIAVHDPDKPIAVIAPALTAARHADQLADTTVSTEPVTRRGVVAAADRAVEG
jgi:hypothetical protein